MTGADGFAYREHPPAPALRCVVACYWTLTTPPGWPPHRVLPDGCLDILVDVTRARAQVVGVMTTAIVSRDEGARDLLGVRFHPGEAPAFLGVFARETRDDDFLLADVWGAFGRAFEGRLAEAGDRAARLQLLDRLLLHHAAHARAADRRVRRAIERVRVTRGAVEVEPLAREVGLGARQLERAFDVHVGLAPKAFARVMRLQALVAELGRLSTSWARLAADVGFSDQAHLVREVRALCGVTPGELLRERGMSDSFNPERAAG